MSRAKTVEEEKSNQMKILNLPLIHHPLNVYLMSKLLPKASI